MKKGKKALLIAGGILAGALVFVAVTAALKSADYRIERAIEISGSADAVFSRVADLGEWEKWSPWKARDPQMKISYSGPKAGVGAVQSWTSPESGEGSLKITESLMNQKVRYLLTFKDWDSRSQGEFRFEPVSAAATRLVWTMEGKNTFTGKIVWLLFGIEKSLVADFDQGLANIKGIVEQARAAGIAAAEAAAAQAAAAQAAAQAARIEAQAKAAADAKAANENSDRMTEED